jgi:hypothetical protein
MAKTVNISSLQYEFTRPADTTAYTSGDVVSNSTSSTTVITFSGNILNEAFVTGKSLVIKDAQLTKSTNSTTNASFRLYLYTSAVTVAADNAAFNLVYSNKHLRVGFIDFTLTTGGAGTSDCAEAFVTDANINAKLLGANLIGVLVAQGAYTPGNAEKFYVKLNVYNLD